jgi:ABC-2 type transport system ATP-binding protein
MARQQGRGERPETDSALLTDDSVGREREAMPALKVDGLTKTFGTDDGQITAVDDVSFSVESGSVVGLLGPNGAGKTTTIKCILGMVLPDAGGVHINGTDVYANPREAYKHVDAMLEGARNDYWRLTVRENLRYFATIGGVDPDSVADRHDRLLDQLDLEGKADVAVRDLSRGMKQKVSLASVLATDADVVFLDEPTLGLDVESSLTLRRELRRIVAERNLTVVLCSHDMDVIEDVCDRVIIVSDGRIIADDRVEDILSAYEAQGFRLTTHDFDDSLRRTIRERFADVSIDRYDGRATIEVMTDSDGFYELSALLSDHDVTLDGMQSLDPDLEEAFLHLTGGEGG